MHIYKGEQANISYIAAESTFTLSSNENIGIVKAHIRSSRRALIFVVEPPQVNQITRSQETDYPLSQQQLLSKSIDLPTNYILATTNVKNYQETAFRLTNILKNSLYKEVPFAYDTKIGEDILHRLRGCQRLDENVTDFRKFLFVSMGMVVHCINNTNLNAQTKNIHTDILWAFYDRANSIYADDVNSRKNENMASTQAKLLVNTERILLRFDEHGFHLAEYQKIYLSNILNVINSLVQIIEDYKTNLANVENSWSVLSSGYEVLKETSKSAISNYLHQLENAQVNIDRLTLLLDEEKKRYFFIRYWKAIAVLSILVVVFFIAFSYLLKFYIKTTYVIQTPLLPSPPIQVNLVQPQPPINPGIPIPIPISPTLRVGSFNFTKLHAILSVQTIALALLILKKKSSCVSIEPLLKKKSSCVSIEPSAEAGLNKLHQQELALAIHKRELRLIEGSINKEPEQSNGLVAESRSKNNILETISKLSDDFLDITKIWLAGSFLSLINLFGKRR
jgi:uncharacterized membrane protein